MPNQQITRGGLDFSKSLTNALSGSPAAPVQQQPTPTPPSSEGSGVGSSLYNAIFGGRDAQAAPSPNPYDNAAKALHSDKFIR